MINSQPVLLWKFDLLKYTSTWPEHVGRVLAVDTNLNGMRGIFVQVRIKYTLRKREIVQVEAAGRCALRHSLRDHQFHKVETRMDRLRYRMFNLQGWDHDSLMLPGTTFELT